jgi:FKBP-type peptidyl-prolyl cis-trans isomerase FkpA
MIRKSLFVIFAAWGLSACMKDAVESEITTLGKEQEKIMDEYVAANNLTGKKEALYDYLGNFYPVFTMISTKGDTVTKFVKNEAIWVAYDISTLANKSVEAKTAKDSVLIYTGGYANKPLGLSVASSNFLGNGGKGKFIFPSTLGYGKNPPGGVEYNALLNMDVQVLGRLSETEQINFYIKKNNLKVTTTTESGLRFAKTKVTTDSLAKGPNVTVKYIGRYANGHVFDKNETGVSFQLSGVVPGFAEALKLMRKGENGVAILPSKIGYGEDGGGRMPQYMPLFFEIELMEYNK